MKVRPLRESDIPVLRAMAEASGFPYPDLETSTDIEAVLVIADKEDRPRMAVAAKRLVELYLWCGSGMTPHESVSALRLLHDAMAEELRTRGYNSVEAFLPENVSGKFGRRLEKTFGWVKNWPSWCRRI